MPFPKANQGKAGDAQGESQACGLCEAPVDKVKQQWIEARCTTCGTRPFHFACVSQFMEREVRGLESKGNRKNDKNLLYAREYPQNIFARNSHIMSRKPVCPGKLGAKDCPGIMDSAEITRPKPPEGEEALPAPGLLLTAKKAKPPVGAVTGKAHKAGKTHKTMFVPPRINEGSSSGSLASSVSVPRLAPAPSKPGGGVAALLAGSKAGEAAGAAAPTFAQQQLQEEKASRREQREQRARDKAAAAELASRPSSASAGAQQSASGSSNMWSVLAGPEGRDEGGNSAATWLPQEAGGAGAGAVDDDADSWLPNWQEGHAPEPHLYGDEDAVMQATLAASLAHSGGPPDALTAHASWAQAAPAQAASQAPLPSFGWAQSPATPALAPAAVHAAADDEAVTFDDGFAAGLAAALRQQQDTLQRQWQHQQEQQQDVWAQPAAATALAPAPAAEPQQAAYWEAQGYGMPPAPVHAGQGGDAEVDELLALMGIA